MTNLFQFSDKTQQFQRAGSVDSANAGTVQRHFATDWPIDALPLPIQRLDAIERPVACTMPDPAFVANNGGGGRVVH